jgi:metallo-beta-lactamase class B
MATKYEFVPDNYEDFYRYPDKYMVEPFRIFGNLFFTGNKDVGSYLIDTGEGLILIDTTYPTTSALLVQSIWQSGHNPKDIVYIFHTHGHFDHFGATRLLKALSGAKTFLGKRDARMFREHPELALIDCGRHAFLEVFIPDVELDGGEVITLGNTSIRVIATPGHSDGVMSYFFNVSDEKTSYTAGLHGGAGLNTLNRHFIAQYGNTHSRAEFLESLARIRKEKVDITLGNHTGQNNTLEKLQKRKENPSAPNPFVDPEEWPRYIEGLEKRYAKMLEDEKNGTDI